MIYLKDTIFNSIDQIVPRWLAAIPYQLALEGLAAAFASDKDVVVWSRNSFKKGNFVFGVSDLDVTIYLTSEFTLKKITKIKEVLKSHKQLYPFLGEANIYQQGMAELFASSSNFFEMGRDPILEKELSPVPYADMEVEKVVFLLRMIYSDRKKLTNNLSVRQKKWRQHFISIYAPYPDQINIHVVIELISSFFSGNTPLAKDVRDSLQMLVNSDFTEENVFSTSFPMSWKYLFPHRHLWIDLDESIQVIKGTFLAKICLRQIEWEIWGIMSQLVFLKLPGVQIHLERLGRLAGALNDKTKIPEKIDKLIGLHGGW